MAQLVLVAAMFLVTIVVASSDMAMLMKGLCLIALAICVWVIKGDEEDDAHTLAKVEAWFSGAMGLCFSFFGVLQALILM